MGLFSTNKPAAEPAAAPAPVLVPTPSKGKAAPTPKRKDAEAARRLRVNPQLSPKDAKKAARREATLERQKRFRDAENTPGKALIRDWVDSRFNPGVYIMPVVMALLVVSLVFPAFAAPITYAAYAFIGLVIVDMVLMWRGFKKLAAQRIPGEPLKGLLYYAFNRAITFRRARSPKPTVNRGDQI